MPTGAMLNLTHYLHYLLRSRRSSPSASGYNHRRPAEQRSEQRINFGGVN
jgi:hypothetical protein